MNKVKLSDFCAYDELSESQYRRFIEARGGCSCHLSPPCSACFEPATAEELLAVSFEDFIDDTIAQIDKDANAGMIARDERKPFDVDAMAGNGCIFGMPRVECCNLLVVAEIPRNGFSVWGAS